MDIKQIRHFLALAEHGTFTAAAHEVGITQPAFSESIRKLEADLDGELFVRKPGLPRLTALGSRLLPRLKWISEEFDGVREEARDYRLFRRVPLRIGVLASIGMERLAPCLARHQISKPEIELEVIASTQSELAEGLNSGAFDIGVGSRGDIDLDLFATDLLYAEDYVVAFPRSHPFAAKKDIDLASLEGEVLLDRPKCEMRDILMEHCADSNINLYAPHRSNNVELIKLQIRAGVGVAVLPRYSLEPDHPQIMAKPLALPNFTRDVLTVRARGRKARPEVRGLLDLVKIGLRGDGLAPTDRGSTGASERGR